MTDVPACPAAYLRGDGSFELTRMRDMVIGLVQSMGWPVPAVYADDGPPGSQLAALVKAISAGRHDAVYATRPMMIGADMDQIEKFDLLCRQHGVRLLFRWTGQARNPQGLFDVIRGVERFTVTDEHLRLLRRAYVFWDETEFGAPGINAKRPYGNSDVYGDIAEILGLVHGDWQDEVEEDWPPPSWSGDSCGCTWRPRSRSRSGSPPASSARGSTRGGKGTTLGSATRRKNPRVRRTSSGVDPSHIK